MQSAKPLDWLGFVVLVIMFGSSFMFIKLAVQAYPPIVVTAARIFIAALFLFLFAVLRKASFRYLRGIWPLIIALAIFGNCIPFYLISWGQLSVDSSIAGILMGVMPLATIFLAHFYVLGERLNVYRIVGFFLGFAGILSLLGPAAIAKLEIGANIIISMLAILGGAISYAITAILAKRLPKENLLAISTAVMVVASSIMIPFLLVSSTQWVITFNSREFLPLVLLGVFPTALATIIYFAVIVRVGPSFLSQVNYLIPVWAVLMGGSFLNESISLHMLASLAIILLGIAIAQRQKLFFARF